jgi:hypothetical protein
MATAALKLLVAATLSTMAANEPIHTYENPIESGLSALYLDGSSWNATNSSCLASDANKMPIVPTVPGDILTDLQCTGRIPDPYFNSSWLQPGFVTAWNIGTWTYNMMLASPPTAAVALPRAPKDARLLVFDGVRMGAMI